MRDETFMTLMRLLPKATLSTVVGMATRLPAPSRVHQLAMKAFSRRFRVELAEAEYPIERYNTFAEFFTRRLKPGSRPIEQGERVVVSPVDGVVSQVGYAESGECLQAKGINFPLESLLGDAESAKPFVGGAFATIYLSPRDYHRVHAPLEGRVSGYRYIPGEFWPVNPSSVRSLRSVFCLNERLVTYVETSAGQMAVVKVGATCVARIRAAYDELVTHSGLDGKVHRYSEPIFIKKGEEVGVFEMGSTVILLFQPGRVRWDPALVPDAKIRLGQRIGEVL